MDGVQPHRKKKFASPINDSYQAHLNPYLNFHRPSEYATTITTKKGKERKIYNLYETPYEHFKKMSDAGSFLREGVTFEKLDAIAYAKSDNECATLMKETRCQLFKTFRG